MFSFGRSDVRQFGGVGVMIDPPAVEVDIAPSERFEVHGPLAERAARFVDAALRHWHVVGRPNCVLTVRSPEGHTGLGVGTQLGLSVAAGMRRFLELSELPAEQLAISVGRGARSAVGTHGFQRGGLIVDAGKSQKDELGQLADRVAVPDEWRFVLVHSASPQGLAGEREADAFARLPPVPAQVTEELSRITRDEMLPAISRRDCASFGDAVYRFGKLAGECFAAAQGGPFASPETARLIETIRKRGVQGVGQSSWGPTVFAIVESEARVQEIVRWINSDAQIGDRLPIVAKPNNTGAQLSTS
jgi:beta-RFAP synthase